MGSAVRGTLQASLDRLHPNTRANPDHRSEPIHAEMAESDRRWSGHRGTSQSPGPVLLRRQCTKPDEEPLYRRRLQFSKSTVSELIKGLDPVVHEWNERSPGGDYSPFPMVDGMVIKIRKNGHLRNHSILIGIGVNSTGVREILGFRTADS
jgi:hypothetical protein